MKVLILNKFNVRLFYGIIHSVRTCAYQGVRNVSFSETFTNILKEYRYFSDVDLEDLF